MQPNMQLALLETVAIMDVGRPELDVVPRVDADWNAVNEVGFRLERQKVG